MAKENRFYIENNGKLKRDQVVVEKKTSAFILNTFEILISYDCDMEAFKKEYRSYYDTIMQDKLPSDTIPLLQHLFRALEKDPANKQIFLNSPMLKYLVKPIYKGHTILSGTGSEDIEWENYEKNPNSKTRISGPTMYAKAIKSYYTSKDPRTGENIPAKDDSPIGIDFVKALSTLVTVNEDGDFVRLEKSVDKETEEALLGAAKLQIQAIKNKPLFKNNFSRKNLMADFEDEDEDDDFEYEDDDE